MLLTADQLAEFKAEGSLLIRSLVPDAVLAGWRKQFAAAAAAHEPPVDLAEPSTWPPGRLEAAWPELEPGLYDLPELQELVQQLGGGAFAPTSQAGRPWAPQQPMTRVVLPEAPGGTEWAPPADGHLDGYGGGGWGGGFMAFFVRQPPPPLSLPPSFSLPQPPPHPLTSRPATPGGAAGGHGLAAGRGHGVLAALPPRQPPLLPPPPRAHRRIVSVRGAREVARPRGTAG